MFVSWPPVQWDVYIFLIFNKRGYRWHVLKTSMHTWNLYLWSCTCYIFMTRVILKCQLDAGGGEDPWLSPYCLRLQLSFLAAFWWKYMQENSQVKAITIHLSLNPSFTAHQKTRVGSKINLKMTVLYNRTLPTQIHKLYIIGAWLELKIMGVLHLHICHRKHSIWKH